MKFDKSIWKIKFSPYVICFWLISIGINYTGKFLMAYFRIPLWFDTTGTILAGIVSGPIGGMVVGVSNNLSFGLLDKVSHVYCFTSLMIGLIVGVASRTNFFKREYGLLITSSFVIIISIVITTPLNVFVFNGYINNYWGDQIFRLFMSRTYNVWVSSLIAEFSIDIIDKILSISLALKIFNYLKLNLVELIK